MFKAVFSVLRCLGWFAFIMPFSAMALYRKKQLLQPVAVNVASSTARRQARRTSSF
jgi:hypothetical protein